MIKRSVTAVLAGAGSGSLTGFLRFDEVLKLLPELIVEVVPIEHPPPGRSFLVSDKIADLIPGPEPEALNKVSRQQHRQESNLHPVEDAVAVLG
jgi:hypothetical protein